jgi:hypothetical protein
MEAFTLNLNQSEEKGKRFKKFILLLAVIYIISSGILFYISFKKGNPIEWIFLIFIVYAAVLVFTGYWGHKRKFYISGDDYALEYQFGFFSKVPEKIIWQTIKKVRIGPAYVAFYKRTGKRKVIQLSWLPYAKVVQIKDLIQKASSEKNIEIEIAEFHKG